MIAMASRAVLISLATALAASTPTDGSVDEQDPLALSRVVNEVEKLDALRNGLAASYAGEPDQEMFARVCRLVGVRARQLVEENGWKVQQLARKNRNPDNALDPEAAIIYHLMETHREVAGIWIRSELDGDAGIRYFRRIVVQPACLNCHGPKDGRPQFVKDGYPEDRAFDFQVGDLRGLYSVFVAD
jgi:hypothetical protein